jgi:hypothetical protein
MTKGECRSIAERCRRPRVSSVALLASLVTPKVPVADYSVIFPKSWVVSSVSPNTLVTSDYTTVRETIASLLTQAPYQVYLKPADASISHAGEGVAVIRRSKTVFTASTAWGRKRNSTSLTNILCGHMNECRSGTWIVEKDLRIPKRLDRETGEHRTWELRYVLTRISGTADLALSGVYIKEGDVHFSNVSCGGTCFSIENYKRLRPKFWQHLSGLQFESKSESLALDAAQRLVQSIRARINSRLPKNLRIPLALSTPVSCAVDIVAAGKQLTPTLMEVQFPWAGISGLETTQPEKNRAYQQTVAESSRAYALELAEWLESIQQSLPDSGKGHVKELTQRHSSWR